MNESKVSDLIVYISKYFVIYFLALIFIDLLGSFKIIQSSAIFKCSILAIFIYILFFVSYIIESVKNKMSFIIGKSMVNSILDITFIVPVYLILTGKRSNEKILSVEKLFLTGFSIFIFMFLSFSVFSYIAYSIPGLPNSIIDTAIINIKIIPVPKSTDSYQILTDNLLFLVEIFLVPFFLLLPSFIVMVVDSITITPLFISLIFKGLINTILPQLLLEILGTAVAAGTSFTIFYAFFISINRKSKNIKYQRLISYSTKLITFGIILSIYVFLVGWAIESTLISSTGLSSLVHNSIYLYDTITIIIYLSFLYEIIHVKYFPLQNLVFPSLASGIALFVTIGDLKAPPDIPYIFFFSFFAIAYSMLGLRKSFYSMYPGNKQFKDLNKLLEKYNCSINSVSGRSMYPVITKKDYLINYNINDDFDFRIGDIITFEPPIYDNAIAEARFVTHRIYNIYKSEVLTKGDNLHKVDPFHTKFYNIYGLALGKINRNTKVFESVADRPEFNETIENVNKIIDKYYNENKINIKSRSKYSVIFNIAIILVPSILIPSLFLLI